MSDIQAILFSIIAAAVGAAIGYLFTPAKKDKGAIQ